MDTAVRYLALSYEIFRAEGLRRLLRRVHNKLRPRRPLVLSPPASYGLAREWARLALPVADAPRVSIIIPIHNQHLHTYTCLCSIAQVGAAVGFEVIVVDDRSTDDSVQHLAQVGNLRLVPNRAAQGFVYACNTGAAAARGDVLVFLNNDTIVTRGWLDALVDTLDRVPDAGLVGARLIYPDGRLQEAGGIVWRDGSAWNLGRDDDPEHPAFSYRRDVDYCSGACIAVPAALFHAVGGFGEDFAPAYYEDADLAFKIRSAGRRTLYQPAATVVHFEGASNGTRLTRSLKHHQILNQRTFRGKWAARLDGHRVNGVEPALEMDRSPRRVLVVDARIPTPDRDSGSLRMVAMLGLMQTLGFKVSLAALDLDRGGEYGRRLQHDGIEVLYAPYVSAIEDYLREHGRHLDAVVLSRVTVAERLLDSVRALAPQARVVFDTVDLRFLREQRYAHMRGSALLARAADSRQIQELALARKADVTLVVSPAEQALLSELAPDLPVEVVSNIVDPVGCATGFAAREGLVFIGNFTHPPNVDAVLFLVQDVLPRVHRQLGPVTTYIVGNEPPPRILALAGEHLVVTGHVPELAPYLDRCRVSVAPLRYGAGVKGKVNSAMAHGLPVVATTIAAEGMHLSDGEHVLLADTAEDFAAAVVRLHQDAALWQRLSANGLDNLRTHFATPVALRHLARSLAVALPEGAIC